MIKTISLIALFSLLFSIGCRQPEQKVTADRVIGKGQMPNIATGKDNRLHVVYGSGDSILYSVSGDGGKTFSIPGLVAVLPALAAAHMRGPQIAATSKGLLVLAVTKPGDIYAYTKDNNGEWKANGKINDIDTVAKEGLMAVSSDHELVFAVWLDLRDKHNKLVGAKSADGGKTWSTNNIVYASPDTTVCECCKPSVVVQDQHVYIMFRNWLKGNRDMYLIHSANAGDSFEAAQKLGEGSWALDGCPMDGGALQVNSKGIPETVWRRKQTIYACIPGQPETALGEGKGCTLTIAANRNIYAWTNDGNIMIRKPGGADINLGKGQLPLLSNNGNAQVTCIWESDKQIHAATVTL
ncbi:BNR/Asp-box repeat protein [Ostertagia ostertagi]